jgi:PleD family two-component response regulator
MQAAIRALAIQHQAGPLGVVTLSAGLASWRPGHLTATPAWLVEEADSALYEAKAMGRNTFTVRPNVEIVLKATHNERKHAA